ncbi:Methionine aminotransferase [bioreactor metagenome]|uniref:Methionine aminotransferase n=1 Tax=bioreactor metagenome TaxID=1076179 RepID=A0A645FI61_9ZZZZ
MRFPAEYYHELSEFYRERRDYLLTELTKLGFECISPAGAYYIMADITSFGYDDDVAFAKFLAEKIGVAVVPGSSFYRDQMPDGKKFIRFCFCKEMSTLQAAVERLQNLRA